MAYRRFPIPEFDHKAFRGLEWAKPDYLMGGEISKKLGSVETFGAFPLEASDDVLKKFSVHGENCHALLCKQIISMPTFLINSMLRLFPNVNPTILPLRFGTSTVRHQRKVISLPRMANLSRP